MAIPSDLDGPTRRRDHARRTGDGNGEGLRSTRVRSAQRHSRLVRFLRIALPASAFAIAAYYAATLVGVSKIGTEIARTAIPKIIPSSLTMKNPRYRGFTKDGGAYVVTAQSATPDAGNTNLVHLSGVTGDLTQKDGTKLSLSSRDGLYDSSNESVLLTHDVNLKTDRGGWARMEQLRFESRTGLITSDQPVEFGNPQSKITGQQLRIMQKSKEVLVTGNVVANIIPPAAEGAAAKPAAEATKAPDTATTLATPPALNTIADASVQPPAPAPAAQSETAGTALTRMFTGGKGPIQITSDRLEIDDVKKTAIFIGQVRAKQGDATMTTPELRIAYTSAPSAGLTGAAETVAPPADPSTAPAATTTSTPAAATAAATQPGQSAKISSIVAANPVAITQAPATHITSSGAAFDAATQRATLDGGVVITRAPDTRITGLTAGFDDPAGLAYIDGNVVIESGADRRATSQHAEFDSKKDTALMTGDVVLIQGKNELRGKRLYVDQKEGRTELTSPPMSGAGPGRISAHFVQNEAKPAKPAAAPAPAPADATGATMMGGFRTDPSAPVDITANQLEVFDLKKLAVFRGDVQAQQGTFSFRTAELNAIYSGSAGIARVAGASPDASTAEQAAQPAARLTRLQARGKVVVTSRNGQNATGDWADFDVAANTATLGGAVVLTQGRNVVKGTRLVIDMTTGESVINTDNSAAPQVAAEKPGGGWRAYQKPSRPSAVFFPRDAKEGTGGEGKKVKSPASSAWQSTTAPAAGSN